MFLGLCVPVLVLWIAARRQARRKRRWNARRQAVLDAIRTRFGLSQGERRIRGEVEGRATSVGLEGEHLIEARFALRTSVLLPTVRLVEFADGPYQKQEERSIGGAHELGDADFDAKFLAYGEPSELRRVDANIPALLLRHWIEGLTVRADQVSLWVPNDPDQAVSAIGRVLTLCDALDGDDP